MHRTYKSHKQKANEEELEWLLQRYIPSKPIDEGVMLYFTAFMPIPKSASRKKQHDMVNGIIPHINKPDLDNLAKQLKDCLTRCGFWKDDKLVTNLRGAKRYGEIPCWHIAIMPYKCEESFDVKTYLSG